MEITNPEKTEKALLEGIRKSGQRFIVSDRLIKERVELPANLYITGYVSYDLLFPHLMAAVHHGGSGTTHTAAMYGLPQLILPKAFDQFYWADRICALELGPRGFAMNKLTVTKLVTALTELTKNAGFKINAAKIRERILEFDGNRLTIEYLLGKTGKEQRD
jgi:UDP:flavonoid glycosyltransferase YjiC (YdhE family)